jgi:tRNA (guanine26-N2/guanine27-N2)-dimethyltransferase
VANIRVCKLQENCDKYPAHVKLIGMLQCLDEELHDVPLFYTLTGLCKTLKVDTLRLDTLRNAVVNAGYRISGTHCNPNGVKTDAPPEVRPSKLGVPFLPCPAQC